MNVTSREQLDSVMHEGVLQLGRLEILVNRKSMLGGSPFMVAPVVRLDEDALLSDFDTKYASPLTLCQNSYPLAKETTLGSDRQHQRRQCQNR
ncbi:MAG: hypothetical protein ACJ0Q8_00020 [Candidatus Azotimanducaceae bacterium]